MGNTKGYIPQYQNFYPLPLTPGRIASQDIVGGPAICHGFIHMHFCNSVIAFTFGWVACFLWLLFASGE